MAQVHGTASGLTEENPLVSVIIPVYKVESYLRECVDSVLKQTYTNLEIILVDDGSPDSSPAICDEYAVRDNRVRVIHKENGGLSDARNAGIDVAKGEYLIFVDSDDKIASNIAISSLVDFIVKNDSTITYCSSVLRFVNDDEKQTFASTSYSFSKLSPSKLFDVAKKNHFIFAAWLFVVKRSFVVQNDVYFTNGLLHEDMEWIPRLLCCQQNLKIDVFTKPFYLYRFNPNSITGTFNQKRFDSLNQILLSISQKISEEPNNQFLKNWFNMNLYNLVIYFEKDCLNENDFYKKNIQTFKLIFMANKKLLNRRNRGIALLMKFNPAIFYYGRNILKGLR